MCWLVERRRQGGEDRAAAVSGYPGKSDGGDRGGVTRTEDTPPQGKASG